MWRTFIQTWVLTRKQNTGPSIMKQAARGMQCKWEEMAGGYLPGLLLIFKKEQSINYKAGEFAPAFLFDKFDVTIHKPWLKKKAGENSSPCLQTIQTQNFRYWHCIIILQLSTIVTSSIFLKQPPLFAGPPELR